MAQTKAQLLGPVLAGNTYGTAGQYLQSNGISGTTWTTIPPLSVATISGTVGTGVSTLDFRGSGISTVTVSSGVATITLTGGSGSGASSVVMGMIF